MTEFNGQRLAAVSGFAAIATVSLRTKVVPVWFGWLAGVAAIAALVLSFAVVDPIGPLAPQGWLSYVLYLSSLLWLIPAATLMIRGRSRVVA